MDNKAVAFNSHLNVVCQSTFMGEDAELLTQLMGSCGTVHFSEIKGRPTEVIGKDWVCDDPFTLVNFEYMKLLKGNRVIKCEFKRPFEHSIDVKPLEIGSEVLYFSGYNVYLNPGASETLATGYSREYAYVVNDSALMLALGGGLF
jgi:hypothetical protein